MLCVGRCACTFVYAFLKSITDRRALVSHALCKVGLVCTSVTKSRLFAGFQCNNCTHAFKIENDIRCENTNGNIYKMESISLSYLQYL